MGRARGTNDAHNSSRQQGDWAYETIDEHEGGGCFIHGQRKPFQEQMEKLGRGPLTTPNSSSCCQGGWSSVFILSHPLLSLGAGLGVGHLCCSQFYYLWAWLIVRQFLKIFGFTFRFLGNKIKLSWFGVVIRRSELLISSAAPRQKVKSLPGGAGLAAHGTRLLWARHSLVTGAVSPKAEKKKMV